MFGHVQKPPSAALVSIPPVQHEMEFIPDDHNRLNQALIKKAVNKKRMILVLGFIVAVISTNLYSLGALVGMIWWLYTISGCGSGVANFTSRTVALFNPEKGIEPSDELQRFYYAIEERIKLYKELYGLTEFAIILDEKQITELSAEKMKVEDLPFSKLQILLKILATQYGKIIRNQDGVIVERQGRIKIYALEKVCQLTDQELTDFLNGTKAFLGVRPEPSPDLQRLINFIPPRRKRMFNYHSWWDIEKPVADYYDKILLFFRYFTFQTCPSLLLVSQVPTTFIALLQSIPGFSDAAWSVQIPTVSVLSLWLMASRVVINNLIKGKMANFQISKLMLQWNATDLPKMEAVQVDRGRKAKILGVAIFAILLTMYYNIATAVTYQPDQAFDVFAKQFSIIPGIDELPQWTKSMIDTIEVLVDGLYYPQLISTALLAFFTSCIITIEGMIKELHTLAKVDGPMKSSVERMFDAIRSIPQAFREFWTLSRGEKMFFVGNLIDNLTFGVNGAFNSLSIVPADSIWGILLAIFTGVSLSFTGIAWNSKIKNLDTAHTVLRAGVCCDSKDALTADLLNPPAEGKEHAEYYQADEIGKIEAGAAEGDPRLPVVDHAADKKEPKEKRPEGKPAAAYSEREGLLEEDPEQPGAQRRSARYSHLSQFSKSVLADFSIQQGEEKQVEGFSRSLSSYFGRKPGLGYGGVQ